jgi:hypothetical protein
MYTKSVLTVYNAFIYRTLTQVPYLIEQYLQVVESLVTKLRIFFANFIRGLKATFKNNLKMIYVIYLVIPGRTADI